MSKYTQHYIPEREKCPCEIWFDKYELYFYAFIFGFIVATLVMGK